MIKSWSEKHRTFSFHEAAEMLMKCDTNLGYNLVLLWQLEELFGDAVQQESLHFVDIRKSMEWKMESLIIYIS